MRLPARAESVARARHALDALGLGGDLDEDLRLVVSELMANSVIHAGLAPDDRIEVRVEARPDGVVVEVRDPGRGFDPDTVPLADGSSLGGRGLALVAALTRAVRVECEAGCRVRAELGARATAAT